MKRALLIPILIFISLFVFSQQSTTPEMAPKRKTIGYKADIGFGFGLDYGGIFGMKLSLNPIHHLTVFASGGYLPAGIGWNLGAACNLYSNNGEKSIQPYIKAMYGVNASSYVKGIPEYIKLFYGATIGIGSRFRFGKLKMHGINVDFNYAIDTQEYYDLLDKLKEDDRITYYYKPLPITFSIGYHYEF